MIEKFLTILHDWTWNKLQQKNTARLLEKLKKISGSQDPINIKLQTNEAWKLKKLMETPGVFFTTTCDGILCNLQGKSLLLHDWNDIFIAVDSFVDFDYSISIPFENDIIIFDIGANVGDTAIVFASNPRVKKVFSFEPLQSVYQRMIKNIEYNHNIKDKIESFNFGLGSKYEQIDVSYPRGCAYCATSSENWHADNINNIKEKVIIHDAAIIINKLIYTFNNEILAMKLDCEGAEFNIIPYLSEQKILKKFSLIMMEFHRTDPSIIVNALNKNNFTVFWLGSSVGTTGRLYAIQNLLPQD